MKKKLVALLPQMGLALPMRLAPAVTPDPPKDREVAKEEKEIAGYLAEQAFYLSLFGVPPSALYLCRYCEKPYYCLTYHWLKVCTGKWEDPLTTAGQAPPTPYQVEQPDTRPEPSENMPGAYAYKSKGVPEGEKMHPNYRPPAPYVAKSTPYVAPIPEPSPPIEEPPKEERPPHWWHWVRPSKEGRRGPEPYTPSLTARRRSIPSIACTLYYASWACYAAKEAHENAPPGCVKTNQIFYELDQAKVERLICLLTFCGLEDKDARKLAGEAWKAAKAGVWVVWKSAAPRLLKGLGYELGDQEEDGYADIAGASFVEAAVEGYKGR